MRASVERSPREADREEDALATGGILSVYSGASDPCLSKAIPVVDPHASYGEERWFTGEESKDETETTRRETQSDGSVVIVFFGAVFRAVIPSHLVLVFVLYCSAPQPTSASCGLSPHLFSLVLVLASSGVFVSLTYLFSFI